MDIHITVENLNETLDLSVTISWCDTNETILHHIADTIDSLPEYIHWDVVPSWANLDPNPTEFKCINYMSFIRNSKDVKFPENVPKTEKYQSTFITLHKFRKKPNYLKYFNQDDFIFPLSDLVNQASYNKDQRHHNKILEMRDVIVEIGEGEDLHTEDAVTKYKRFVVKTNFTDLVAVFDVMKVSVDIPFIMYKGIIKTLNHFRPPQEWLEMDSEAGIIFKIKHGNKDDYSTGVVVLETVCYCILDTSDHYKSVDENILLENLKICLDDDNLLLLEQSTFLTYSLVGAEFHSCYLSDIVMHKLYSLFFVDEYVKPSKNTNRLYLHMVDGTGNISLFQKYTKKPFQFNVPQGTPFMSIRIKTETVFMTHRLKMIVLALISFYKQNVKDVINFYKKFITIKPKHKSFVVDVKKKPLKLIAPEIFLPMYSRRCLNMPSIVTHVKQNQPFIKFPLFGESQARLYVCTHKKYKYPGLRVNELANRETFPFVPCCYSKDQKLNPVSKLNKYINKTTVSPKIKHSQGAILNLPVPLKQYFTYVDILSDYILLSNPAGPLSLPNAVHYAIYKSPIDQETVDSFEDINLNVCAQEEFPTDVTNGIYPNNHIRLLEVFFNVSIFLFDKNGPMLPNYKTRYLKSTPKKKTILIFVKESGHCLPLAKSGAPTIYFPLNKTITKLYTHLEQLAPQKFTNQSVHEYFSRYEIIGQVLNSERHCIFFICLVEGKEIPIATEPQLPFEAPTTDRVFRLENRKYLEKSFKQAKVVIVGGIVKEATIPFSSKARILCNFTAENVKLEESKSKELFPNIVSVVDKTLIKFYNTKKQVKMSLEKIEQFLTKIKITIDQKSISSWLIKNKQVITKLTGVTLTEKDVEKIAYLIVLKFKNNPQQLGLASDLDLYSIEPRDNQVVSVNKDVMQINMRVVKYKPHLKYLNIGDKLLIHNVPFECVETLDSESITLIYEPETNVFYSNVTEIDESMIQSIPSFKTWFWDYNMTADRIAHLMKLFNSVVEIPAESAVCNHATEDGVCVLCGAITQQVLISNTFIGVAVTSVTEECLQLPLWVDPELRIATLDLFGHLNTTQIRMRKKRIILITCLLYVCSKQYYKNVLDFYKNFNQYNIIPKEILFGIDTVERSLKSEKNIYNLDFKFHEMCLMLVELDKLEYIEQMCKFHTCVNKCYNRLRIKSVVVSCLYILKENYNIDINIDIKKPTCFQQIKQEIFAKCIERNIKQYITIPKNLKGKHNLDLYNIVIQRETNNSIYITENPFSVKVGNVLINDKQVSFNAWQVLFENNLFHPDGNMYNANIALHEFINTPMLNLGLII